MNEVRARLLVKLGPNPDKEFNLTQQEITIGRSSGNSIVMDSPEVSRRHARIRRAGDNFYIEDWGSTNGTFVSGQRVMNQTILRNGDSIKLGDSIELLFIDEPNNINLTKVSTTSSPEHDATIVDAAVMQKSERAAKEESPITPAIVKTEEAKDEFILPNQQAVNRRNQLRLFGCGCLLLLIPLLCIATLVFLDSYEQGRLLYCGPVRPLFEIFLGPLGFAPICS